MLGRMRENEHAFIVSSALTIMHSIDSSSSLSSSGTSFPPEECSLQRLEVEALKDGENSRSSH